MSVAERLGVPIERVEQVELLRVPVLPDSGNLFDEAFRLGPDKPEDAQMVLAAAILSRAQHTPEGRLSGALSLIAQLVARANPMKTLGPEGARLRAELMPSGWKAMTASWEKTRYAWREGMEHLLDVKREDFPIVQALNEITRLHPADPEPVAVAIQETFPAPGIAFAITFLGVALTARTALREVRSARGRRSR